MSQRTTILAIAVIAAVSLIATAAAFRVVSGDDPSTSAIGTATAEGEGEALGNSGEDIGVTVEDLASMVLDEEALSLLSPSVAERLIHSPMSGVLANSPLNSDRVRLMGAAGWTETYNLDGIRDAPPLEHRGLFRAAMQVFLFADDHESTLEFTTLLLSLPSGVEPSQEGAAWDGAVFYRATRDSLGPTEHSSVAMFRVGPALGFVSLASTLEESHEATVIRVARALAERVRERLSMLGAFAD